MDDETKAYLDGRFAEIDRRFTQIDGRFAEIRAAIEKTETNLLRAFHGWARSMEIRVRSGATSIAGFDERLGFAEERIGERERKKSS
jgi:hypothetical protein